jgi:hypothetical protein
MNSKIIKPGIFFLAFLFTLALYWPAMHGKPIWDDVSFWFDDPAMKEQMAYWEIFKHFAWPISVSIQKFTLSLWGKNYFYYHFLCLSLHFINSLLVYKLGRLLRLKYPLIFFLLFLLHPTAVITTAWMIQIKTLLCFFFALVSLLTFLKGNKNVRWMIGSWLFFFLSIASKSVSLTLPLILLMISLKQYRFQKLPLLIPFFILSLAGGYRLLVSPITLEGSQKALKISKINERPQVDTPAPPTVSEMPKEESLEPVSPTPIEDSELPQVDTPELPTVLVKPSHIPKSPKQESIPKEKETFTFIHLNFGLISQTLHYYFWQALIPNINVPVRGLNYEQAGMEEIIHLFFLICLIVICWKDSALIYLAAGHVLLLPFLGIIPAPFMTITWVSDQHLYLALPALLAFWMRLADKLNWKYSYLFPSLLVVYFSYQTMKTTPLYKDQFTFFESSLNHNSYNVPIAYNLAFAYLSKSEWKKAYTIVSDTYHKAQEDPLMKKNFFYPYLSQLYLQMRLSMEKNEG